MDKNTFIGLLLIVAIFIGYYWITKPTDEQIAIEKARRDSIARVEQERQIELENKKVELAIQKEKTESNLNEIDSLNKKELESSLGKFAGAVQGSQEFIELENELLKITFSNRGGKIYSVQLKNYKTYDSMPLILFNGDSTRFGLNFFSQQNRQVVTDTLYFVPINEVEKIQVTTNPETLSYRLNAGENGYIQYNYTLSPNSYMLDFDIEFSKLNDVIRGNERSLDLNWELFARRQEKGIQNENNLSTIFYKYHEDDEVDDLSARKEEDEKELRTKVKWIAFKQHFFSSVIIAKESFISSFVKFNTIKDSETLLKQYTADLIIPYNNSEKEIVPLQFYFGPNHHKTLKKFDLDLEELIPLGPSLIRWVNLIAVIPIFNFLSKFIDSYGLIILLLTLIIKLVLYPLTFKSYASMAKMRVLKPQLDEINKKFPKRDDAMKKQQATMALYKKAGVSPMGGCLPMLLQFPILFAMFRFFPSSIELRQESFLWAHDLSTYDAILEWSFNIPLIGGILGNHLSLFTLLMTLSSFFSMRITNQASSSNTQMPGMKTMMYFMPIMFFFVLNNYSSGLTYYYFLANMITLGQNALSKRFIDDEAVLKKLQANAKKVPKKSKFQERLEKAAKERAKRK